MGSWKKIEEKLKLLSKSITFEEICTLLIHYGYEKDDKGKTSGSRVRFTCNGRADILLHKPHPQKELKSYVIKNLLDVLKQEGVIK